MIEAIRTHGAAAGQLDLVSGSIVVAQRLLLALGHLDGVQRRDLGRGELVQRSVDVPPVEPRDARRVLLVADYRLVERLVVRVLKPGLGSASKT